MDVDPTRKSSNIIEDNSGVTVSNESVLSWFVFVTTLTLMLLELFLLLAKEVRESGLPFP